MNTRKSVLGMAALTSLALFGCGGSSSNTNPPPPPPPPPPVGVAPGIYVVTSNNQIVRLNRANPATVVSTATITGLTNQEFIYGIDIRPVDGLIYGHVSNGSRSRLVRIDPVSGAATEIGTSFDTGDFGLAAGFDFNPTVDRVRIVNEDGRSIRVNPTTGVIAGTDTNLSIRNIPAIAYSNNVSTASQTTLYGITSTGNNAPARLVRIGGLNGDPSPDLGAVTVIGNLGIVTNLDTAFDIGSDGTAIVVTDSQPGQSGLYTINLQSGEASFVGNIGIQNAVVLAATIR